MKKKYVKNCHFSWWSWIVRNYFEIAGAIEMTFSLKSFTYYSHFWLPGKISSTNHSRLWIVQFSWNLLPQLNSLITIRIMETISKQTFCKAWVNEPNKDEKTRTKPVWELNEKITTNERWKNKIWSHHKSENETGDSMEYMPMAAKIHAQMVVDGI